MISRTSKEYKEYRARVLARDGNKCQHCGDTKRLEVHHVIPYKSLVDLQVDSFNGLTLCKSCHMDLHGKSSKKRKHIKQLLDGEING